jgi:hypothetical protein
MRATSGTVHTDLLTAASEIQAGNMPPATQALRHLDFELDHFNRTYFLRFLDYPGELFRKVFYDSVVDSDEARELYNVSTSADGVIALTDPESILDRTWDIDYAMTNLLRFYSSRGHKVPEFVLAFTKRDCTETLVGGSVAAFVRSHLPHLAAALGEGMRLQHFCSVVNTNGTFAFSRPETVSAPLRSVIDAIEQRDHRKGRQALLRSIAWKEAAFRSVLALLAVTTIIVAFVSGVVCRDQQAPLQETTTTSIANG